MKRGTYLREDLEVTRSTFSCRDAAYVVRAGHRYYAVDSRTAEIVGLIQQGEDERACAASVSSLLGEEVSNLAEFVAAHFPAAWQNINEDVAGRAHPFLVRLPLLSASSTQRVAGPLRHLFGWHAWLLASVAMLVAVIVSASSGAMEQLDAAASPLLVVGLAFSSVLVHEIGHASALARVGGKSNGVGFGIYWGLPTFYADVTECWRLDRHAKLLVNIGGVYFQLLYMSVVAVMLLCLVRPADAFNFLTITSLLIAHTLNPALKFDGYWLLNDMLGKTSLHKDIRHIFLGATRAPGSEKPTTLQWALLTSYLGCATVQIVYMCWSAGNGIQHAASGLSTANEIGEQIGLTVLFLVYVAIVVLVVYKILATLLKILAERSHAFHPSDA